MRSGDRVDVGFARVEGGGAYMRADESRLALAVYCCFAMLCSVCVHVLFFFFFQLGSVLLLR